MTNNALHRRCFGLILLCSGLLSLHLSLLLHQIGGHLTDTASLVPVDRLHGPSDIDLLLLVSNPNTNLYCILSLLLCEHGANLDGSGQ